MYIPHDEIKPVHQCFLVNNFVTDFRLCPKFQRTTCTLRISPYELLGPVKNGSPMKTNVL